MICFSACLVFEVINHQHHEFTFYENIWMLVKSADEEEATRILMRAGLEREESFTNVHGELLEWKFKGLRQLKKHRADDVAVELVSISGSQPGFVDIAAETESNFAQN